MDLSQWASELLDARPFDPIRHNHLLRTIPEVTDCGRKQHDASDPTERTGWCNDAPVNRCEWLVERTS